MPNKIVSRKKEFHNLSHSPEYKAWSSMLQRCYRVKDISYSSHGGRGILVCEQWRNSFATFFRDVGLKPSPRHSLDRYPNNDGNYEPGNVRWATRIEQNRNTRWNHPLEIEGETRCMVEWCQIYGVKPTTLINRINRAGLSPLSALTWKKYQKSNHAAVASE